MRRGDCTSAEGSFRESQVFQQAKAAREKNCSR